jgi:hypothetical protein
MLTPNESKLANVTTAIHATPPELVGLYTARLGVEASRQRLEAEALQSVLWQASEHTHPKCDGPVAANQIESWFARQGGSELGTLARLDAIASALERHPRMGEAVRILQPLCDERDRLVAAIASDNAEHQAALAAAESALQSATQAALAAVETDPKVLAARAALARFNGGPGAADVPLVRGKIAIGKGKPAPVADVLSQLDDGDEIDLEDPLSILTAGT